MKKTLFLLMISCLLTLNQIQAQQLAFPSAEGFGRFATGGRGGSVYHVTNLNDSGPGSFRDAVSQSNRTVVFDVGGVINIDARVVVASNITIAGQTAPGGGICIYGNGLAFTNAHNSIVRYIRIRMGVSGDSGKDAIAIARGNNMIFDHVSVSWGRDGTFDINADSGHELRDITVQNCIIAQGLETHSTGGLIQATGGVSLLRNLWIDNNTRNPKVKGINQFVNNVVYNWNVGAYILGDSQGPSAANVTNNYFINGPNTSSAAFTRGNLNFHIYASNNYQDSNRDGVLNGSVIPQSGYGTVSWESQPYPYPTLTQMTPAQAYNHVVANAGASLHRDQVDTRLITELTSLGQLGQLISNENNSPMNGPGVIQGGSTPADSDQDGMPNSWETANGFNPNNASDRNGDADGDGYTNLEEYLNGLVGESSPGGGGPSSVTIQENSTGFCSVQGTIDNNHSGFTGSGFANANNATGAGIEWRVNIPSGGSFSISWRYANGTSSNRPARLLVNGSTAVSTINFTSTSGWASWSETSVNVNLNSGVHTLRLEATNSAGLANIDYLKVSGGSPQAASCNGGARLSTIIESPNVFENGTRNLFVAPNPIKDNQINLKMYLEATTPVRIKMVDLLGRELLMEDLGERDAGELNHVINVDKLYTGTYLMKVQTNKGTFSGKVIKN